MITIEWEVAVSNGPHKSWERKMIRFHHGVSPFEAKSMAAGLRAEAHNIRNVRVIEERLVKREI